MINRRRFLTSAAMGGLAAGCSRPVSETGSAPEVPSYLAGYESRYAEDPRAAALEWFRDTKLGLFIHYGLYSQVSHGEWLQYDDTVPIAEYAKLAETFDARNFDAEFFCQLAKEAEMKYINLVCKHCDSFALWDTNEGDFDIMNSPCKRDLVKEMSDACRRHGLGFFAFYEHGFDWRHPHGPAPWLFKARAARPAYDPPDPHYAPQEEYDFQKYVDYANAQITELLTRYGDIAGIWLDGIGIPLSGDKSLYRAPELYAMIRSIQPQALISYKYGLTGDEDFFAPEDDQLQHMPDREPEKPMEVCTCMQYYPEGVKHRYHLWGDNKYAVHKTPDAVWEDLKMAARLKANLLLNVGPLGDGSVDPEDVAALRAVGERIRKEGFPAG